MFQTVDGLYSLAEEILDGKLPSQKASSQAAKKFWYLAMKQQNCRTTDNTQTHTCIVTNYVVCTYKSYMYKE